MGLTQDFCQKSSIFAEPTNPQGGTSMGGSEKFIIPLPANQRSRPIAHVLSPVSSQPGLSARDD